MNIVIFLHDARISPEDGMLHTTGDAFVGPGGATVAWEAIVPAGSVAIAVNAAIRDAAIAAAAAVGLTVEPSDQKTLIAGAALL